MIVGAGIAGYRGHRPHAPQWGTPHRRADREAPHLKPYLEAMGILAEDPPLPSHTPDHKKLNLSGRPAAWRENKSWISGMPVPGYGGHMPRTSGNATESFGTSYFRPDQPVGRRAQAALAQQSAQAKGLKLDSANYAPPEDSTTRRARAQASYFEQDQLSC